MDFFPSDSENQEFVLSIYRQEILLKAHWAKSDLNEAMNVETGEAIMRHLINAVTNAMSIVRMLNSAGARNAERANERVNLLINKWPDFPREPQGLRVIRNDLEHYEERLDQWVEESTVIGRYWYIDLNVGLDKAENTEEVDYLRNLDKENNFYFWNHKLNIDELIKWLNDIEEYLED